MKLLCLLAANKPKGFYKQRNVKMDPIVSLHQCSNCLVYFPRRPYDGEYDNLLYYFAYQYDVVQGAISERDKSRQRKRPAVEADDELSHMRKHSKLTQ